jgi:copper chaperone CopZ
MTEPSRDTRRDQLSFTVQTIDCMACTPVFRRNLGKLDGVLEVREFPVTNRITVEYDGGRLTRDALAGEIIRISQKAGFGGKVVFRR